PLGVPEEAQKLLAKRRVAAPPTPLPKLAVSQSRVCLQQRRGAVIRFDTIQDGADTTSRH
ncbi:MAG TPA: hypothetical protein VF690_19545, partial [Hymenobacter sp.]